MKVCYITILDAPPSSPSSSWSSVVLFIHTDIVSPPSSRRYRWEELSVLISSFRVSCISCVTRLFWPSPLAQLFRRSPCFGAVFMYNHGFFSPHFYFEVNKNHQTGNFWKFFSEDFGITADRHHWCKHCHVEVNTVVVVFHERGNWLWKPVRRLEHNWIVDKERPPWWGLWTAGTMWRCTTWVLARACQRWVENPLLQCHVNSCVGAAAVFFRHKVH